MDAARGFEYEPLRTKVHIERGQRELTLRLKRWTNMNAQGWYSGDSHVHFLSTQGSHLESQGEDLNVVNLLQSQWGDLFTNTEEFTGPAKCVPGRQQHRLRAAGEPAALPRAYDPVGAQGAGDALVQRRLDRGRARRAHGDDHEPLGRPLPRAGGPRDHPALSQSQRGAAGADRDRTRRRGGDDSVRAIQPRGVLPVPELRLPPAPSGRHRQDELPTCRLAYTGRTRSSERARSSTTRHGVPTWPRGRTFLSGGPIMHFAVDGHEVGDTVQLPGAGTVEVEAWAESVLPMHRLEIVKNGRVVAATGSGSASRRLELRERIAVDGDSWLAARCGGPSYYDSVLHHDAWSRGIFAHTSPVYVACGGAWRMFDPQVARYMLTMIEGGLVYIDETSARRQPGSVTHHHGEADHMAYLRRPFLEAQDAVRRRLEEHGLS